MGLLLAAAGGRLGAQAMEEMKGPPTMAVFNLSFYGEHANSIQPGDTGLAVIATGVLRSELRRYPQFKVLDSSLTYDAVAKVEAAGPPCVRLDCARSIAMQLGARWVVTGRLSKLSNLIWYLFGQVTEVSTGKLLSDQELELKGISRDIVPKGAQSLSRRVAQAAGFLPLPPDTTPVAEASGSHLDVERVKSLLASAAEGQIPDLSGLDLSSLDLRGIDFRRAKLAGANLFSCDLTGAILADADLTGANLDGTTLRRADLRRAKLAHASLFATIVEEADLSGADLSETRIIGYLKRAKLAGAILRNANIGADPGNQSMGVMRAAFVGADLSGADLSGANLFKVDFSYARLTGANLRGADLSNGELVQTDFSNADLTDAKFAKADISGAIFKGARGLSQAHGINEAKNRDKAVFDEHME